MSGTRVDTGQNLSYVHRFEAAKGPDTTPLLLLHGTGGNEDDLLPVGRMVSPNAALLSPRGKVLENGMPRFFRRLAEGVFDEADVRARAQELGDFVGAARVAYGLSAPIAIGYSNGANIAAAMLLLQPGLLAGAILLRAMVPLSDPPAAELGGIDVLIISGARDPIIPAANAARLAALLSGAGATVDHRVRPEGHGLTQADIDIARQWYTNTATTRTGGRSGA